MAEPAIGPASFWTQANALLRKNVTFQKRNVKTNVRLVSFPFLLCILLVVLRSLINSQLNNRSPPEWSPLVQIPAPEYRAVITSCVASNDFPNELCRRTGTCPATLLFTGSNQTLGKNLVENMLVNTIANFSSADNFILISF